MYVYVYAYVYVYMYIVCVCISIVNYEWYYYGPVFTAADPHSASEGNAKDGKWALTDHFSVRWTTTLVSDVTCMNCILICSIGKNDGARLYVDGKLVIDTYVCMYVCMYVCLHMSIEYMST